MWTLRILRSPVAAGLVAASAALGVSSAAPAAGQVASVRLTDAGRPVPLDVTEEQVAVGRAIAHGLLAGANRDVTRPITDRAIAALGRRGTLLQIRLTRAEQVYLVRLGSTLRSSRIAAYVPPARDDHAFVFLGGGSRWQRILMVSLPDAVRRELQAIRARGATR